MLSEYECSVYFRNCPNALRIGLLHRMLSVCFPNDFSMLSEQAEYFPHVHIDRFPPRTFSVWFPNAFRIRRIEKKIYRNYVQRYCSFCCASQVRCQDTQWQNLPYYLNFADITGIRKGFGKGSLCSRAIWGVRKEYGTYWKCTSSSENIRKAYWNTERILETFGKHSSCSRSIRCVR